MDLEDHREETAFRERLREWLAENLDAEARAIAAMERGDRDWVEASKAWSRRLFGAGFCGLHWPRRYGGQGMSLIHHVIALEELARAEAPEHVNVVGLGMAGPTLLEHGTDEQKARYVRPILSGEEVWCQGFSEPGAGTDLAAISCRARCDGDSYVISGQKVWSSFAHVADRCILLARTGSRPERHRGLSYFLVDMHAPGVEVRRLRQLTGEAEFNEIFLDDVRVAADHLVGPAGEGWRIAITTLMNERVSIGVGLTGVLEADLRRLAKLARETSRSGRPLAEDPSICERLGRLQVELHALRAANYRSMSSFEHSSAPGPEGAVPKLIWSEATRRLTRLALEIEGGAGVVVSGPGSVESGAWQSKHLRALANTIEGGTSEILRDTIAERILGLPKSR